MGGIENRDQDWVVFCVEEWELRSLNNANAGREGWDLVSGDGAAGGEASSNRVVRERERE